MLCSIQLSFLTKTSRPKLERLKASMLLSCISVIIVTVRDPKQAENKASEPRLFMTVIKQALTTSNQTQGSWPRVIIILLSWFGENQDLTLMDSFQRRFAAEVNLEWAGMSGKTNDFIYNCLACAVPADWGLKYSRRMSSPRIYLRYTTVTRERKSMSSAVDRWIPSRSSRAAACSNAAPITLIASKP